MAKKDNSQTLQFKYDYLGRRVRKTVRNGAPSAAVARSTKFVWSGWQLQAELDAGTATTGSTLTRSYLWGQDFSNGGGTAGGAGGLLAVRQDGVTWFPVYNLSGSITSYLRSDTGAATEAVEYTPYGDQIVGGMPSFSFGFATQYTDSESKLSYYGFRYFNQRQGAWLTRDSIEEAGGLNLYGFVGNNPANRWDVLGMLPEPDPQAEAEKRERERLEKEAAQKRREAQLAEDARKAERQYNLNNGISVLWINPSSPTASEARDSFGSRRGIEFSSGGINYNLKANGDVFAAPITEQAGMGGLFKMFRRSDGKPYGSSGFEIETVDSARDPRNNGYAVGFYFRLPKGSNGLVIQEVWRISTALDADGKPAVYTNGNPVTTRTYWEAFPVVDGFVSSFDLGTGAPIPLKPFSDVFAIGGGINASSGYIVITGVAQFFEGASYSDVPNMQPGNVASAISFNSSYQAPRIWNDSQGGRRCSFHIDYLRRRQWFEDLPLINVNLMNHFLAKHLTVLVLLIGTSQGLSAGSEPSADTTISRVTAVDVSRKLESMPCWLELKPDDKEVRGRISKEYYDLARLDTGVLRSGVELFLAGSKANILVQFRSNAKVYALLRVAFRLPEGTYDAAKVTTIIGFCAPAVEGKVDLLWPFTANPDGSLSLTGSESCESSGPMFDSRRAFDQCDGLFGRRAL